MLLHVDNLRRSYEREHTELEETKRVLIEHKLLVVRTSSFFTHKQTGLTPDKQAAKFSLKKFLSFYILAFLYFCICRRMNRQARFQEAGQREIVRSLSYSHSQLVL